MPVEADRERAVVVFGHLLKAFRHQHFPFDRIQKELPQNHLPVGVTTDPALHARFLFFVCHLMRGRIRSDLAVTELSRIWSRHPELFMPETASRMSAREIMAILNGEKKLVPSIETPTFWVINSEKLLWHGGDPRALFSGVTTGSEARQRIANTKRKVYTIDPSRAGFMGFQEKMVSMLAYFLMAAELIKPFVIAPAVDFHLMRVMINTGVLRVPPSFKSPRRIAIAGTELLEWYCAAHKVHPVTIGDAMWVLSRALCARSPGIDPVWDEQGISRYQRTCGRCSVRDHCTNFVPASEYYRRGMPGARIIAVRQRSEPPTELIPLSLFPPDLFPHMRKPDEP